MLATSWAFPERRYFHEKIYSNFPNTNIVPREKWWSQMRKAFFRSDYPLGYRMSDGSKGFEINPLPNAENYYALALSVYENMPSGKALYKMGIAPEVKAVIYEDTPSRQLSKIAYVLTALCGMQQKVVAPLLSVSKQTLRRAIKHTREGLAT